MADGITAVQLAETFSLSYFMNTDCINNDSGFHFSIVRNSDMRDPQGRSPAASSRKKYPQWNFYTPVFVMFVQMKF